MRYGLVYKINGECFLSKYDENGILQDGDNISDNDSIYQSLEDNQISLVEWSEENDIVNIMDLSTITLTNKDDPDEMACVLELMDEGFFPEFAETIWQEEVVPRVKNERSS